MTDFNEAWAAIVTELNPPDQPEGTMSLTQYAERARVAESTALRQLEQLVSDGRADKIHCRILSKRGHRVPGFAYRLLGASVKRPSKRTSEPTATLSPRAKSGTAKANRADI